ncbi:MAG: hypoxanthine phosphoribosyltransferase [Acidaminococcaceae bacterium]|nr:hypoxanthine phosphoribosyltransferase [Acidaminococcaceae bacterium]
MSKNDKNDIEKILVTREEIAARVKELAAQISEDYKDKDLLVIGLIKGVVYFMCDLTRELTIPADLDFMRISSYGSGTTSGQLKFLMDASLDIKDRDVLLLDDIVDSGNTLKKVKELLLERHPRSLKIAVLLDKKDRREVDIDVDYIGFNIPDHFVVGNGLDYNEHYRNLGFIGVLKPAVYKNK